MWTSKTARIALPFIVALGAFAETTCVERGEPGAGLDAALQVTEAQRVPLAGGETSDAPEDARGGAICVTDDGAPYESDAC